MRMENKLHRSEPAASFHFPGLIGQSWHVVAGIWSAPATQAPQHHDNEGGKSLAATRLPFGPPLFIMPACGNITKSSYAYVYNPPTRPHRTQELTGGHARADRRSIRAAWRTR